MMIKKTVLFFIFDGFADWEITHAMVGIRKSNCYNVKTMALKKDPIVAMSGLSVMPCLDFIPHFDLKDIDQDNTAMLVLPGGSLWRHKDKIVDIELLMMHCIEMQIPIAMIDDAATSPTHHDHRNNDLEPIKNLLPSDQVEYSNGIITTKSTSGVEFAKAIFDALGIAENEFTLHWFQKFETSLV